MLEAIIVSDLHLGSENCQAKGLCRLFEKIHDEEILTAKIILNGDVFDSIDFRRLNKSHWKVLSLLRKMSDHIDITWICGNHDGTAEIVSHLLGVKVCDDIVIESGAERILILHGHIFDEFLDRHPILTWFGDTIYAFLQRLDGSHSIARYAKSRSKIFLRCAEKIMHGAVALALDRGCTAVCCGHTHQPAANKDLTIPYYNSGSWTELPCTYLTIAEGVVQLHRFEDTAEKVETEPAPELTLSPA